MLSFKELTEARSSLQSFCLRYHIPSLLALQSGISFKLLPSEDKNLDDGELHHPTTTASQPIKDNHARSAILFGPPGTSKTTLVRRLADVIGWKYVELHASHFVADGLTQVQKTADKIFKQLSELDHAVVLFDEIDELVRERDMEKDAFGRFLTTSMLPKLAELWEARKVLYFVATNHINYFDSAIIRSHRFDALILVSPPSFEAKTKELNKLLPSLYGKATVSFDVTESEIQDELKALINTVPAPTSGVDQRETAAQREEWREQELLAKFALAKFVLLRWDELNELAYCLAGILKSKAHEGKITPDLLREALIKIADSEWRKNKSYADYERDTGSERRDYSMLKVWSIKGSVEKSVSGIEPANGHKWLARAVDSLKDIEVTDFEVVSVGPACVELRRTGSR